MKKIILVVCVGLCSATVGAQVQLTKTHSKQATIQAAVERQIAQTEIPAVNNTEIDDMHQVPAVAPVSDKPVYYMTDAAYRLCTSVPVCENWVRQQAQTEIHFQVLEALLLNKEDLHHQQLVVKYITYQAVQEKVFDEDFSGWKEK